MLYLWIKFTILMKQLNFIDTVPKKIILTLILFNIIPIYAKVSMNLIMALVLSLSDLPLI
jgi:hypothetical protein